MAQRNPDISEEQLSAFLDGELSETEWQTVVNALATSAETRAALERMRRTVNAVRQLPRYDAPDRVVDNVMSQIERRQSPYGRQTNSSLRRWMPLLASAAVIGIATTIGLWGVLSPKGPNEVAMRRLNESAQLPAESAERGDAHGQSDSRGRSQSISEHKSEVQTTPAVSDGFVQYEGKELDSAIVHRVMVPRSKPASLQDVPSGPAIHPQIRLDISYDARSFATYSATAAVLWGGRSGGSAGNDTFNAVAQSFEEDRTIVTEPVSRRRTEDASVVECSLRIDRRRLPSILAALTGDGREATAINMTAGGIVHARSWGDSVRLAHMVSGASETEPAPRRPAPAPARNQGRAQGSFAGRSEGPLEQLMKTAQIPTNSAPAESVAPERHFAPSDATWQSQMSDSSSDAAGFRSPASAGAGEIAVTDADRLRTAEVLSNTAKDSKSSGQNVAASEPRQWITVRIRLLGPPVAPPPGQPGQLAPR